MFCAVYWLQWWTAKSEVGVVSISQFLSWYPITICIGFILWMNPVMLKYDPSTFLLAFVVMGRVNIRITCSNFVN